MPIEKKCLKYNKYFDSLTMSAKFKSKSHEKRLTLSNITCYATYLRTMYITLY